MPGPGRIQRRWAALAVTVLVSLTAIPARADTPLQIISTAGPLDEVRIGADLSCQIGHVGDTTYEVFPFDSALADCGTFLTTGGTLYGPDFAQHPRSAFPFDSPSFVPYTSQTESPVTGAGTAASPYTVVTTVGVADTGFSITQTDSYVTGDERFRTDIVVKNTSTADKTATLYRGIDCYLQDTDTGYGVVTTAGTPACAATPNNTPSGRVEELSAQTPGFRYMEGGFSQVWSAILAQTGLPNTCDCLVQQDNGAAVSWDISVPAGGSATYSVLSNFSPSGQVVGAPATVTGQATGTRLTGTVDPDGSAVTDCHFDYGKTTAYGSTVPCAEAVGTGTDPVPVSARVSGLQTGQTYHYRLSAATAGGTTTGSDMTLSVTGLPAPVLGKTVNLLPVSGKVYIRTKDTATIARITKGQGFVPLAQARQIPVDSLLDARQGTVDLVAADSTANTTRTVRLTGGVIGITQLTRGLHKGLTTLKLRSGAFKGAPSYKGCPTRLRKIGNRAHVSKSPKTILQTLKASDKHGKFRTAGRYSAGTVRGTAWTTTERCDGTLTKVKRGRVDVRDFARRKTIRVRAGHQYLAKALRARRLRG